MVSHEDTGADAERDGEAGPPVEEVGIRTVKPAAGKKREGSKTLAQKGGAAPDPADDEGTAQGPEVHVAGMVGAAFDAFAAGIGDNHQIVFREVPRDAVRTTADAIAIAHDMAEDINARKAPGQRAEVATFDIVEAGASVFIGARVRFV